MSFILGLFMNIQFMLKNIQYKYFGVSAKTESVIVRELNSERLMTLVNDWRVSQGYLKYESHPALCKIANNRLEQIKSEYSHNKFVQKYENYPSYVSENLVFAIDDDESALNAWLSSTTGHREAIEAPFKYSCIAASGVHAVQIFSNCEKGCP